MVITLNEYLKKQPVFNYTDKPEEAVQELIKHKEGIYLNPFWIEHVGYFSLYWGENNKNGISKIYDKYMMTVQAPHLYTMRTSQVCSALIDATCLPNSAFFVPRLSF